MFKIDYQAYFTLGFQRKLSQELQEAHQSKINVSFSLNPCRKVKIGNQLKLSTRKCMETYQLHVVAFALFGFYHEVIKQSVLLTFRFMLLLLFYIALVRYRLS